MSVAIVLLLLLAPIESMRKGVGSMMPLLLSVADEGETLRRGSGVGSMMPLLARDSLRLLNLL